MGVIFDLASSQVFKKIRTGSTFLRHEFVFYLIISLVTAKGEVVTVLNVFPDTSGLEVVEDLARMLIGALKEFTKNNLSVKAKTNLN